jgi:hypothetical protein
MSVLCRVCNSNKAQYSCPRCQCAYCGVECYRKHGSTCTEAFFREHVLQHVKSRGDRHASEQRQQVEQMLLRNLDDRGKDEDLIAALRSETSQDSDSQANSDDEFGRFAAALEQLDAGNLDASLAALSDAQREEFFAALQSGSLAQLVDQWTPWWVSVRVPSVRRIADSCVRGTSLVQVLDDRGSVVDAVVDAELPELPTAPPAPLASLTSRDASPLLCFNLLEILFAYAHTLRVVDGEWSLRAARQCVRLSAVLSERALFRSVEHAIDESVARRRRAEFDVVVGARRRTKVAALSTSTALPVLDLESSPSVVARGAREMSSTTKFVHTVLDDVVRLLACRRFTAAALADLVRALDVNAIAKSTQADFSSMSAAVVDNKKERTAIVLAQRKLQFYQSWLAALPSEQLDALGARTRVVVAERCSLLTGSAGTAPTTTSAVAAPAVAVDLPPRLLKELIVGVGEPKQQPAATVVATSSSAKIEVL